MFIDCNISGSSWIGESEQRNQTNRIVFLPSSKFDFHSQHYSLFSSSSISRISFQPTMQFDFRSAQTNNIFFVSSSVANWISRRSFLTNLAIWHSLRPNPQHNFLFLLCSQLNFNNRFSSLFSLSLLIVSCQKIQTHH